MGDAIANYLASRLLWLLAFVFLAGVVVGLAGFYFWLIFPFSVW